METVMLKQVYFYLEVPNSDFVENSDASVYTKENISVYFTGLNEIDRPTTKCKNITCLALKMR